MIGIEYVRNGIEQLYKEAPSIHISICTSHPKVVVENGTAVIIGVYKSIFQVEENSSGHTRRHTFQYNDVLIGQVRIAELNYKPIINSGGKA